jgi:hypothetical protein
MTRGSVEDRLRAHMAIAGTTTSNSPGVALTRRMIEQKNGAVIRQIAGYGRLEGAQTAEAPNKLYTSARLFVNFPPCQH